MHLQASIRNLLIFACLMLMAMPITAQDAPEQPAPQFLYRDENRLILVDGYTGAITELPIEINEYDNFSWSPDGRYLLARLQEGNNFNRVGCLNLYDVDALTWLYDEPISCNVSSAIFASDGERLIYKTQDDISSAIWLFNLTDETSQELYQIERDELDETGIDYLQFSPTETYLTFVSYTWIMGGTLNSLVVMNMETQEYFTLSAPNPYYAQYAPIWLTDDSWFLITLREEYATPSPMTRSNYQGDVYLMNSETGEQYRLTYTPAIREENVRWEEDGSIAFTEVIRQDLTFTIEEAMNVEELAYEEIIRPAPIELEIPTFYMRNGTHVSPDPAIGFWVESNLINDNDFTYILNIGDVIPERDIVVFSIEVPESYQTDNIIIGWRPSDYVYGQG